MSQAGYLHINCILDDESARARQDNWNKLAHLVKYLRGSRYMPLILSANGSGILKWWVDAAFAVHPNMRGHSGGGLSLGRGFPIISSTKQKLNTRSSTEAEIVGADDFMPAICWTRYFMEAQGYHVKDNVLFQDNKSAILLEKNGKASSSKHTKHINIRYFLITNRVNNGDVSLSWCLTGDMIGVGLDRLGKLEIRILDFGEFGGKCDDLPLLG